MTAVVIALYSFMALRYVALFHNVSNDIATLAGTLTELRLRGGSSLEWLEIGAGISVMVNAQTVAMAISFVASIFFFYMRHHGNE
jgi:hypothetical protein